MLCILLLSDMCLTLKEMLVCHWRMHGRCCDAGTVVGCERAALPINVWTERVDHDHVTVHCNSTTETWQLTCRRHRWVGRAPSNCTAADQRDGPYIYFVIFFFLMECYHDDRVIGLPESIGPIVHCNCHRVSFPERNSRLICLSLSTLLNFLAVFNIFMFDFCST